MLLLSAKKSNKIAFRDQAQKQQYVDTYTLPEAEMLGIHSFLLAIFLSSSTAAPGRGLETQRARSLESEEMSGVITR